MWIFDRFAVSTHRKQARAVILVLGRNELQSGSVPQRPCQFKPGETEDLPRTCWLLACCRQMQAGHFDLIAVGAHFIMEWSPAIGGLRMD
jgi:hypothetical protein